jgi:glycerol kinase
VIGPVLAIDQGTSGTKALVVCPERGVIASATVDVRPRYGTDGSVEVDPRELLVSVLTAGQQALAEAGEPIAAVGLANQGETVLAWDRATGEPRTPAIVWQDRRSSAVCAAMADRSEELAAITGLPLDPYFAAPKMRWLRDQLTGDGVVTTSDAWLINQLAGGCITDASTASRTMLLDLDTADWSPVALTAFELDGEQLPTVVDGAGAFGEVAAFGGAPLTGLAVDQQAALLAQGCLTASEAKCTYGTGAFLLANVGDRALRSHAGLSTSVAWRLAGHATYCFDGQVYTVGSAVRWLIDQRIIDGPEDLDLLGGTVPDSAGAVLVPAFAGLAAPHWRPDAAASLSGLTLATTRAHIVRALMDGIAAQVVDVARAVSDDLADNLADGLGGDLAGGLTSLRVDGGLTRSSVLMQTQADLLQVPVEVYPWPDATALGVAGLARLGLSGLGSSTLDLSDVVPAWTPSAIFEPRISADQAAERLARIAAAAHLLQS